MQRRAVSVLVLAAIMLTAGWIWLGKPGSPSGAGDATAPGSVTPGPPTSTNGGGYQWDAATRVRYANDLGDSRTLVPVTGALNDDKQADDPQRWLPPRGRCRYVAEWVAVKTRWRLSVDPRERTALVQVVDRCPNPRLRLRYAGTGRLPFVTGRGTADRDVQIASILVRPSGSAGETLTLVNRGAEPARLVGWVLSDATGAQFRLPSTSVAARGSVHIHGGAGRNGSGRLYARWGTVWNDGGDTAYLRDGRRRVTDTCSYRGSAARAVQC